MITFEQAINELIELALKHIAHEYNEGGPHYRAYHNTTHTTQVIDAVEHMTILAVTSDHITVHDALLCKLAAAFHDVVHNGDSDPENERLSAEFTATLMHTVPVFTKQDISHVQHMILATKCIQKYPKLTQSPPPHDFAAKILCDADLASFGKPFDEFYTSAIAFSRELYGPNPTTEQLKKYLEVERELLHNHSFWTTEATQTYPHVTENYRQISQIINSR